MPTPEEIERAEELAFNLFQIPAAIFYGTGSAFTQAFPLTTRAYSDVFGVARVYALIGLLLYLLLLADATLKAIRMFRLMMLSRLKPWGIIIKTMGIIEVTQTPSTTSESHEGERKEEEECLVIRVPLTGFATQIIFMFFLDLGVAFVLSICWIMWIPFVFCGMVITLRSPKSYYAYIQRVSAKPQRPVPLPPRALPPKTVEEYDSPTNSEPSEEDDKKEEPVLIDVHEEEEEDGNPYEREEENKVGETDK